MEEDEGGVKEENEEEGEVEEVGDAEEEEERQRGTITTIHLV